LAAIVPSTREDYHRRRLRSTNGQERLNEELRRRERVIPIFPNRDSAIRLLGALLMEHDEPWSTGRRSFDMTASWQWRMAQPVATSGPTTAPGSGAYGETGVACEA
jgi:putative transposase